MAQLYLPDETSELVTENRRTTRWYWMFFKQLVQAVPANGAAPADAEYLVGAVNATLTAERVVTNTSSVEWDLATAGQAKADLTDTTVTPGSYTSTNLTVDAQGRITAAANGGGGTVTTTGTPANGNLTKFSGATSITNGDLSGDVTTSGTLATTIAANAVTDAKFRQSVATSVVGRSANSTGNVADIQATVDNQVFVRRSSALVALAEQSIGYWSPLTNGDPVTPELIWDSFGDTISVWTAA